MSLEHELDLLGFSRCSATFASINCVKRAALALTLTPNICNPPVYCQHMPRSATLTPVDPDAFLAQAEAFVPMSTLSVGVNVADIMTAQHLPQCQRNNAKVRLLTIGAKS